MSNLSNAVSTLILPILALNLTYFTNIHWDPGSNIIYISRNIIKQLNSNKRAQISQHIKRVE